jgi:hypothetical protein
MQAWLLVPGTADQQRLDLPGYPVHLYSRGCRMQGQCLLAWPDVVCFPGSQFDDVLVGSHIYLSFSDDADLATYRRTEGLKCIYSNLTASMQKIIAMKTAKYGKRGKKQSKRIRPNARCTYAITQPNQTPQPHSKQTKKTHVKHSPPAPPPPCAQSPRRPPSSESGDPTSFSP